MHRRFLFLLLSCSALVSPRAALASECDILDSDKVARSVGYQIVEGTLKGAVFGAIAAGVVAALIAPAAGVTLTVFAGVTLFTGVYPAYRTATKNSTDTLMRAVGGF